MKNVINTYAAYSNDTLLRIKSSSGAMFTLLARYILKHNGAVFGVAMRDDCYGAEYRRVTDLEGGG